MSVDVDRGGALRVATYNLRGLRDDVGAVVGVLRAIGPDVLLLQELPRGPGSRRRIAELTLRCGLVWPGRTRRLAGTGVLTAPGTATLACADRPLPVDLLDNPRGYTMARVRHAGREIAVVSLHLPLRPATRTQHARQILSELTADPALTEIPWVLGGDVNERPGEPAWTVLDHHLPVMSPHKPTFPTGDPRRVIDAIYGSPELRVLPHGPLGLERAMLTAATDHLPVWVDLSAR